MPWSESDCVAEFDRECEERKNGTVESTIGENAASIAGGRNSSNPFSQGGGEAPLEVDKGEENSCNGVDGIHDVDALMLLE